MQVRLGNFGGKGRVVGADEIDKQRLQRILKSGVPIPKAYDWSEADKILDSLWFMPDLPLHSRIQWLRYHDLLRPLSLLIASLSANWESDQQWLASPVLKSYTSVDYQVAEDRIKHEREWEIPKKWRKIISKNQRLSADLMQRLVWCDLQMADLQMHRKKARTEKQRKSDEDWTKEHPWERHGAGIISALMQASYGINDIAYNKAMCLLWWSGEVRGI